MDCASSLPQRLAPTPADTTLLLFYIEIPRLTI
jgi:hypothetical protein